MIGVLGGMGPLATADFMAQLVRLTDAGRDQDHHRCLVYSNPHLPDRTAAILGQGPSPLPELLRGVALLERSGVDMIAIPCNTAHFWLPNLRDSTKLPILSIVEAVARDLRGRGIEAGRIGVLGTLGTVRSAIYERGFAGSGLSPVGLSEREVSRFVEPAIRAVKSGQVAQARPRLDIAVGLLERQGVRAVVLGCTELPLALPEATSPMGTPLVDSTRALAAACVAWADTFAVRAVPPFGLHAAA